MRSAEEVRRLHQQRLRDAGDAFHPLRPVSHRLGLELRETLGARFDVGLVEEPIANQHVQQAVGERAVAAGDQSEVKVCRLGGGGAAGVDHDQLATARALGVEVLHDRGHRLGEVAAHEENDFGAREVLERERQAAIDAEGLVGSRRGRRHAEAPIVVDVRGAQRHARELAEQVRLLVGQRAAPEEAHRVGAVPVLNLTEPPSDQRERFVPTGGLECSGRPSHQRPGEPHGVAQRLRGGEALDAELTLVDGEGFIPRDDRQTVVEGHPHSALERAVRAVGFGSRGHAPREKQAGCHRRVHAGNVGAGVASGICRNPTKTSARREVHTKVSAASCSSRA